MLMIRGLPSRYDKEPRQIATLPTPEGGDSTSAMLTAELPGLISSPD